MILNDRLIMWLIIVYLFLNLIQVPIQIVGLTIIGIILISLLKDPITNRLPLFDKNAENNLFENKMEINKQLNQREALKINGALPAHKFL